jgi:hypothetical protein
MSRISCSHAPRLFRCLRQIVCSVNSYLGNTSRYLTFKSRCVIGAAMLLSANAFALQCSYVVNNDWGNGFTANITVTNNGTAAVNGWQVQWQQNGGSTITSSWNATTSGSNPYTAVNLNWNGNIAPGTSQSFGVQGNGDISTASILSCTAQGETASSKPSSVSSAPASSRASSSVIIASSSTSSSSSSVVIQSSSKASSSSGGTGTTFTVEENAAGFCGVEGTIDSNHTGFGGVGFANAENLSGKGIDYAVTVPASGNYQIKFRYGNGSTAARPANLIVNGVNSASPAFGITGAWTTWADTPTTTIFLSAGNNVLRLQSSSALGLANIDSLVISGDRPSVGTCPGTNGGAIILHCGSPGTQPLLTAGLLVQMAGVVTSHLISTVM